MTSCSSGSKSYYCGVGTANTWGVPTTGCLGKYVACSNEVYSGFRVSSCTAAPDDGTVPNCSGGTDTYDCYQDPISHRVYGCQSPTR